jgi:hypothetical protein
MWVDICRGGDEATSVPPHPLYRVHPIPPTSWYMNIIIYYFDTMTLFLGPDSKSMSMQSENNWTIPVTFSSFIFYCKGTLEAFLMINS